MFQTEYLNIEAGLNRCRVIQTSSCHLIDSIVTKSSSNHCIIIVSYLDIKAIIDIKQWGLIFGAIEDSSRCLKAIDEHVFINLCDKNAVFTSFRNTNYVFEIHDKTQCLALNLSVQDRIANLFYR